MFLIFFLLHTELELHTIFFRFIQFYQTQTDIDVQLGGHRTWVRFERFEYTFIFKFSGFVRFRQFRWFRSL